ncbi:MAG: hypothetical protein II852_14595 [Bacteroidales bacterium]|nr:hypothetical protein [Bacteroidales bacterium]
MKQAERKEALKDAQRGKPFATGYQLLYRGALKPFDVWEIPMEALIYNQYNGRIGSVVKSYEKQSHTLNPEDEADISLIESFLMDSKKDANKKTMDSLRKTGQIKFGIVTSDGVIIDGNRRASLMNHIRKDSRSTQEEKDRCKFFKAVILPENATKKDILQLETSFQMGEDEKVDYNPIEKYLKCKDLEDAGFTRDEIASFMGINKKDVDQNLEILDLMDQYLEFYGYDGMYTMAEGHEDSFQKLNIALRQYKAGVANMWDYSDEDINNVLGVAFDYIRLNLPQNDIRDIFRKPTQTNSSIFASKERWLNFFDNHQAFMASFEEKPIEDYVRDASGNDITPCLQARDVEWRKKVAPSMTESFKKAQDAIDSQLSAKAPTLLITKAKSALDSIDSNSMSFQSNADSIISGLDDLIAKAQSLKEKFDESNRYSYN